MALNGFKRADQKVSVHEGGYVDHPKDPGGATNKGVIQRTYDSWRKAQGLATRSVRLLTEDERVAIYKERFWNAIQADKLPAGLDYVVYDGAVNSGPQQSVKWLQRALGTHYKLKVDGRIGPGTLEAIDSYTKSGSLLTLIDAVCDRRLAFMQSLAIWSTFGKGWSNRVRDVRATGKAWAAKKATPIPVSPQIETPPAVIEDAKAAPPRAPGDAAIGGGIGAGGIGGAIEQARDTLMPYSYANEFITRIVVFLIIAGIVLTIGGFAYRWWATRQKAKLEDALDLETGK